MELINIETNSSNQNNLGLLRNFPTELLGKLNISNSFLIKSVEKEIEVIIIYPIIVIHS
mgnify:CR=1 FL=1